MRIQLRTILWAAVAVAVTWVLVVLRWLTLPGPVSAEAADLERIARLMEWLRGQGAFIHRCLVARTCPPYGGRCMWAECDLRQGELLIGVPPHLQLTAYNSFKGSPCPELEKALLESPEWHFKDEDLLLLIRLMKEHSKGAASPFWHYLATLPTEYSSILWDEDEQKRCFSGTPGELHVARRFSRDRALGRLLRICHVATSEAALRWAKLTVDTRAFSGNLDGSASVGGRKEWDALVPFADIFNDDVNPTATWSRNKTTGVFEVKAAQAVSAGTEVLISYGAKTNEKLLSRYGFIHADNPRDKVTVYLEEGSSSGVPPSVTLSLGQVDRASLKFELRHLEHLRQVVSAGAKKEGRSRVEALALSRLRARCLDVARFGSDTIFGSNPAIRWMCDGYRAGLRHILGACDSFVEMAIAELEGKAVAKVEGPSAPLAHGLLDAWREVYREAGTKKAGGKKK